jgi:signal transduction histidine kinase
MERNGKDSSVNVMEANSTIPVKYDPLVLAIFGLLLGLTALVLGIALLWGSGPVLAQHPWYIPLISAFVSLTSLSVAYLALGRYQVLRDAISFWVGCGFAAYGIGQIFYALTWPGVLPSGSSILGQIANTPALIALLDISLLAVFLLAAILLGKPGKRSFLGKGWVWLVGGWLLLVVVGFGLLVFFESSIPLLVSANGTFTSLQRIWTTVLIVVYAAGSILSTLYYRRWRDRLAGYIAFPQIALVFISMMVLIGGKRYDLWWYVQRVVLVGGHLIVFYGLLTEYVRLLQRESQGREMLDVILENIPVGLAVTGGAPYFPLVQVSRHGLQMNQRPVEALIGAPAGFHQVTWKIFLPDGITMPVPEQMPLYRASRLGEEVRNVELLMEAQDGRKIPVLVNAAPIRNAQGKITAAINTWQDISNQKRAEESLHQLNIQLESRVEERTAELQSANQALVESGKRLQNLSQRLVEVQDEERRAIARELHDRVGQTLAALNINMMIMQGQLPQEAKDQLGSRLDDSMRLVSEAISLVRNVMTDLRPAVLEDYGLEAAIQAYISDYQSRYGIEVHFDHPSQPIPRMGSSMEITLLRIAQEALTNVARHAKTEEAKISLDRTDRTIQLTVQDAGIGMNGYDTKIHPQSHGMKIMRERAEAFGGSVTIKSAPGEGTTVEAVLPIEERVQG